MERLITNGENVSRYGIVYLLIAFDIFKFTATEAKAIKSLISNSFIFIWFNKFLEIRTISKVTGVIEIIAATGIALRLCSPLLAFWGSILGCIIFFTTLTFLFTTPGMITKTEGLWLPDGFLIKDLVLLGFCLWSAGEAHNVLIKKVYQ